MKYLKYIFSFLIMTILFVYCQLFINTNTALFAQSDYTMVRDTLFFHIKKSNVSNPNPNETTALINGIVQHMDEFQLESLRITGYYMADALTDDDAGDRTIAAAREIWGAWLGVAQQRGVNAYSAEPNNYNISPFRQLIIRLIQGQQGWLTDSQQHALHNYFTRNENSSVWHGDLKGVIGAVNRESFLYTPENPHRLPIQAERPTSAPYPIASPDIYPTDIPYPTVTPTLARYSTSVRVVDSSGYPIPDVQIHMSGLTLILDDLLTDSTGTAYMTGLQYGPYTFKPEKPGYRFTPSEVAYHPSYDSQIKTIVGERISDYKSAPTDNRVALHAKGDSTIVVPGQTVDFWINVYNAGTSTWNDDGDYTWQGIGEWSSRSGTLWKDVPTGEIISFSESISVPYEPRTYWYGFVLQYKGVDFGPRYSIEYTVVDSSEGTPDESTMEEELIPIDETNVPKTPTDKNEQSYQIGLRLNYSPPFKGDFQYNIKQVTISGTDHRGEQATYFCNNSDSSNRCLSKPHNNNMYAYDMYTNDRWWKGEIHIKFIVTYKHIKYDPIDYGHSCSGIIRNLAPDRKIAKINVAIDPDNSGVKMECRSSELDDLTNDETGTPNRPENNNRQPPLLEVRQVTPTPQPTQRIVRDTPISPTPTLVPIPTHSCHLGTGCLQWKEGYNEKLLPSGVEFGNCFHGESDDLDWIVEYDFEHNPIWLESPLEKNVHFYSDSKLLRAYFAYDDRAAVEIDSDHRGARLCLSGWFGRDRVESAWLWFERTP